MYEKNFNVIDIILDDEDISSNTVNIKLSIYRKYLNNIKKKIYILHISIYDKIRIINNRFFQDTQLKGVNKLLSMMPEVNKDNSFIYTICDLKLGLSFIPDLRMINNAFYDWDSVQKEKNIKLSGIVAIMNFRSIIKLRKVLNSINFIVKSNNVAIVSSYNEALIKIEEFAKK